MLPSKQALAAALRALFGLGRAQRRGPLYREEPTSFENLRCKRHAGYSTTLVGAIRNAVEPTSSVIERRAATFPLSFQQFRHANMLQSPASRSVMRG
jgi:hypothetical protein